MFLRKYVKLPYILYILYTAKYKRKIMIDYALKDSFFEPIVHDLIDYGYEITFSIFGGAGAYHPHALTTEALDTPEKRSMFTNGFKREVEVGTFKAKIKLSLWLGRGGNIHSFLHELMHFYQDMLGFYLLPLKEQGVVPVMADARTSVIALLFCEAWAQVEALRACWSFRHRNVDSAPWKGALASPDWGSLARFYDKCMAENRGEAWAAAQTFEQWYKGKHRGYYEKYALSLYDLELERLTSDVDSASKTTGAITAHLRGADLFSLILKIPKGVVPSYFGKIDWKSELFNEPRNGSVLCKCADTKNCYWSSQNENIHEVKCASPPYLWKRLRMAEIEESEVPPLSCE